MASWGLACTLGGPTALVLFLVGYVLVISLFAATLGLGWALEPQAAGTQWPAPQRYGRLFSAVFLTLLAALGGFPPFFLLGPKLALFSWLAATNSAAVVALGAGVLLLGWYVYWQGASGLFENGSHALKPSRGLTQSGATILLGALLGPLALSGCMLDLWALAHWLV